MNDLETLEFKTMTKGQGGEVSRLVSESLPEIRESSVEPYGYDAFMRYISPDAIERRMDLGYTYDLAYITGTLAGMCEMKGPDRISMLFVGKRYLRRGIGSRLIARAVARCAERVPRVKRLTVFATDGAVDFYERVGFVRNGSRCAVSGIFSTPYRLSLKNNGKLMPSRLQGNCVDFFVFSGTGNSLLVAQAAADVFEQRGKTVRMYSMDELCPSVLREDAAIGLAFPVACFATYPTVWRFIDSMPEGGGREIFMMGTCGAFALGMQGPLGRILLQKGYKTTGAQFFVMPGNYNNETLPLARNRGRVARALPEARSFACDVLDGRAKWGSGLPVLSSLLYRFSLSRRPWRLFYRNFPLAVDAEKCIRCGRCAAICPEGAIKMERLPVLDSKRCESCQRCVAFCSAGAIHVPGKPAEPYRALSFEEYMRAFSVDSSQ